MNNEQTVYINQFNQAPIPVTVRADWLADGTIKPFMYWAPDNSSYMIKNIYESVPLALLKAKGEGIRYRVSAEAEDAYEHRDMNQMRYENYLYLASSRFCEKGFIDQRYGHAGKKYIPVTLDIFPSGDYELVYFWVDDKRYMVEKTIKIEPRASLSAGGMGIWHKVEARLVNPHDDESPFPNKTICRQAALYMELNKWFVRVDVA